GPGGSCASDDDRTGTGHDTPKAADSRSRCARTQALGGIWDTQRAVLALRVAGYEPTSDEAAGKEARRRLRDLADDGVIVRPDPDHAVYRLA
ncbi:hypothetical protein ACWD4L_47550, partial [Streptomyces sp. NPDC002596]